MKPATATTRRAWLFAALAVGTMFAAGEILPRIDEQRKEFRIAGEADIGSTSPDIVLFTTMGGPFRAIAINVLWMRATDLQDKGEVFELVQLFDLITRLEPRFPMVWAYAAWNLAYNVSVKFPAFKPEQRWRWVSRGIETLRDRGIPYNPNAPRLYQELSWIYAHKIGQNLDDAHHYYKVMLAYDTQRILGEPPHLPILKRIAAAPKTRSELLADPAVRSLAERLREADPKLDPFDEPLAVITRGRDIARVDAEGQAASSLSPAVLAILEEGSPGVAQLDAYLRAQFLRKKLRLEPNDMIDIMDRLGPIDWRMPDAHALYWAERAIERFPDEADRTVNIARNSFHALVTFYQRGRLTFVPREDLNKSVWLTSRHFDFVDKVVDKAEAIANEYIEAGGTDPIRDGFCNFLREIILDLYIYGTAEGEGANRHARAVKYWKRLRKYGQDSEDTFAAFIQRRLGERFKTGTIEQTTGLVQGFLYRAIVAASLADYDLAGRMERIAKVARKNYNDKQRRVRVEPIERLYPLVFKDVLRGLKRPARSEDARRWAEVRIENLRSYEPFRKYVEDAEKALEEERKRQGTVPAAPKATS